MATNWEEELGRRMQDEHKALHQLVQVLKQHIIAMPVTNPGAWLDGLRAGFDRLFEHVRRTFELKRQDGYLNVVTRQRPTLTKQVEAIYNEHAQLVQLGEFIRRELAELQPPQSVLIADASARIQRYMAVLGQHEQRENMLALFAFNQDLGGQ